MRAPALDPAADVWANRHGLGSGPRLTASALRRCVSASSAELAESTGKHAGTVRRHLAVLVAVGLAEMDDDGRYRWIEPTAAILDDLTRALGSYGRGDLRRLTHELHRAAWKERLRDAAERRRRRREAGERWAADPHTGELVRLYRTRAEAEQAQRGAA